MPKQIIKLHSEPGYIQRSFNTCDWVSNNSVESIIHERNYWKIPRKHECRKLTPAQLFFLASQKMDDSEYWVCQQTYTIFSEAESDAKKFEFRIQKHFYCEDDKPNWFPIFKDLDKAIQFVNAKSTDYEYVFE